MDTTGRGQDERRRRGQSGGFHGVIMNVALLTRAPVSISWTRCVATEHTHMHASFVDQLVSTTATTFGQTVDR